MDKNKLIEIASRHRDIKNDDFSLIPENVSWKQRHELICKIHGKQLLSCTEIIKYGCLECNPKPKNPNDKIYNIRFYLDLINRKKNEIKYNFYFKNKRFEDYDIDNTYLTKKDIIEVECPIHGRYKKTASAELNHNSSCRLCAFASTRTTYDEFIRRSKEIHGDYYDYSLVKMEKATDRVKIICPKHGLFIMEAVGHYFYGRICKKCAKDKERLGIDRFIEKANEIHNNKYDYSLIKYLYNTDIKVPIRCPKHGVFIQRASSHLEGRRCPKCHLEASRKGRDKFIENSKDRFGENTYNYDKVVYVNNKTKVTLTCPKHGDFQIRPDLHLALYQGCRTCRASIGEKRIACKLRKLNIPFILEYRISRYRYDFFLPTANLLIEYDGIGHFKALEHYGGKERLRRVKMRDKIKNQEAFFAGYKLIRLNYKRFNKLEKFLVKALRKYKTYWLSINNIVCGFENIEEIEDTFLIRLDSRESNLIENLKEKTGIENINFIFNK